MILTLQNVRFNLENHLFGIKKVRIHGFNNKNRYMLLEPVSVILTDGKKIVILDGYKWDLASVPRIFWSIVPPDSDAEIAFLIHDYLYENKIGTRAFADKEMLKWSIEANGTKNWSLRNIDNYVRYYAVKWFGWIVWNK